MFGKLIKAEVNYILEDDNGVIIDGKLSHKNCQTIENGYDLDELIESSKNDLVHANNSESLYYSRGVYYGFQKALEILGDKKFSKYDMLDFAEFFMNLTDKNKPFQKLKDWESLQQTEWDVEIVTKPYTEVSEGFNLEQKREFKLDKDGCLILKRI